MRLQKLSMRFLLIYCSENRSRGHFGNCVALVKAELKHGEVKGDDAFVVVAVAKAMAIGAAVRVRIELEIFYL